MTPFHSAASKGNRKVMEVLIENGCNIHAEGDVSKTVIGVVTKEMLVVGRSIGICQL